jgi:hypothetical protein
MERNQNLRTNRTSQNKVEILQQILITIESEHIFRNVLSKTTVIVLENKSYHIISFLILFAKAKETYLDCPISPISFNISWRNGLESSK